MDASDVMGRNVATITPEKTIQEAAELMLTRGVSALPVVDPSGILLGMAGCSGLSDDVRQGDCHVS